ncbi:MAG: alkaline phosphatase D family protein [Candidatus Hydrogenedentes bacterium]|nr:alkaline phosphatase D family protein [Candidatus Hydrogenedentota bacterium]
MRTLTLGLAFIAVLVPFVARADGPYLGNGIKSGEATQSTIIIWTRLTTMADISGDGIPWPLGIPKHIGEDYTFGGPQIAEGHTLNDMAYALLGAPGEVRVSYWPEETSNFSTTTNWSAVSPEADFTHQFRLTGLQPNERYRCVVEARSPKGNAPSSRVQGTFRTAPAIDTVTPVTFVVVTGQAFWRRDDDKNGHKIYPKMAKLDPNFFVHTGDIVYYDKARPWSITKPLARYKWNRMYALPYQRTFHNRVASYFLRDDHDTWQNDCWPAMSNNKMGELTYTEGVEIFFEQVPAPDREKPYRTIRWGRDLQIWLSEGRDYRSANTDPDGPGKTIWGAEQMVWFKKTVTESDATFRVLISPTPVVGPDRKKGKNDNHANAAFAHEGNKLRAFMAEQKNMIVICGDRHWQYASIDPRTRLREYCSGPTSDVHAGGFRQDLREPMHQYLNIIGGFLSCTSERRAGEPVLVIRHHDVAGDVVNEDVLTQGVIIR